MTWSRFDDGYHEHEKVLEGWFAHPPNPVGLHVMATTACNRWLSDGVIRPRWLAFIMPEKRARERVLATCVEVGLFDVLPAGATRTVADLAGNQIELGPFTEDRYVVHDFLDRHDSSVQVEFNREWDRRRKELERDRDLIAAIKRRDGDRCRYCGTLVNWRDRRGPKGGTYDHVIPRGDNSLANVVVACRQCNNRKGARTPDQAGMEMLQPGDLAGSTPDLAGTQPGSGRHAGRGQKPLPTLPKPYPNPLTTPPIPPASGGGRRRSESQWRTELEAWAAVHFAEIPAQRRIYAVEQAVKRGATTLEAVTAHIDRWFPELLTGEAA